MKPLFRLITCVAIGLSLTLVACGDDNPANTGNEVVEACSEIVCPPGTTRYQDSSAEAECSASGSLDILTESGSVSGKCLGSGECLLICQPPEPCCGGEAWTETSYTCETPCAATCSCEGKCGVVTGADCEADCGSCGGGQVCSDNVCADGCPEGGEPCGDACAFAADGEVCHLGEICNPAEFCAGRECNDQEWDGNPCEDCEALGAPGCSPNEVCGGGVCVTDDNCKDELPVCGVGDEADTVKACKDDGNGNWAWGEQAICSSDAEKPYCANLVTGADCVACTEDAHCELEGEPGETLACQDNACVVICTPDCTDKDCGADGCGGLCGIAETTNGCAEDAPYCQDGDCETWEEACPVVEGQMFCNGSKGDGEVYVADAGQQATLTCQADDSDVISLQAAEDCADNTLQPLCADGACVECVEDANCKDDGDICFGNACVEHNDCPGDEGVSVCNAGYMADESADALVTCAYDAENNEPVWTLGEVCEDQICFGGVCVDEAVCPAEVLCNIDPASADGAKYIAQSPDQGIVTCAVVDNALVFAFDGQDGVNCASGNSPQVCVQDSPEQAPACEAPATCPEPGQKCAENWSFAAYLVCTVDPYNELDWGEPMGCETGDICVPDTGACDAPKSCPGFDGSPQCNDGQYDQAENNDVVTCTVDASTNTLSWDVEACGGKLCAAGACDITAPVFTAFTVNEKTGLLPEISEASWLHLVAELDSDDVASVTFYDGDEVLAVDTEAPFEHSELLASEDNGTHTLKAVATDTSNNLGSSDEVTVSSVLPPAGMVIWELTPPALYEALGGTEDVEVAELVRHPDGSLSVVGVAYVHLDEELCAGLQGVQLEACLPSLDNDKLGAVFTWAPSESAWVPPTYEGVKSVGLYPVESAALIGGNLVLTGQVKTYPGAVAHFGWKVLDKTGKVIFEDHLDEPLPGSYYHSSVVGGAGDRALMVGAYENDQGVSVLIYQRMAAAGALLGQLDFQNEDTGSPVYSYNPTALAQGPTGELYIAGVSEPKLDGWPQSEFVRRINSDGETLWTKPATDEQPDVAVYLNDVAVTVGGEVIAGGMAIDQNQEGFFVWKSMIRKYTPDGALVWQLDLPSPEFTPVGLDTALMTQVAVGPDGKVAFGGMRSAYTGEFPNMEFHELGTWVGVLKDQGDTAEVLWELVINDLTGCDGLEFDELGYLYVMTPAVVDSPFDGAPADMKLDPHDRFWLRKIAP
jgi:hypothetical protein